MRFQIGLNRYYDGCNPPFLAWKEAVELGMSRSETVTNPY
jgi:hypothetical protein